MEAKSIVKGTKRIANVTKSIVKGAESIVRRTKHIGLK